MGNYPEEQFSYKLRRLSIQHLKFRIEWYLRSLGNQNLLGIK